MRFRSFLGAYAGRAVSFALTCIFRRSASQLPGRVALAIAGPALLADLSKKLSQGAVMVCGTNGKTTTNNVVALALKSAGKKVVCNYKGANMQAGIATALLPLAKARSKEIDWAVLEVDELSTARTLPYLKPRYFVLLNLFRDQLDRAGEIDYVQDIIAASLTATPQTQLIVCGDDPLSMGVVTRLKKEKGVDAESNASNSVITFGIAEKTAEPTDRVPEARFCQVCGAELAYEYRHYAQLGSFYCPHNDFARPPLDFVAKNAKVTRSGASFEVSHADVCAGYPQNTNEPNLKSAHETSLKSTHETDFKNAYKTDSQNPRESNLEDDHKSITGKISVPFGGLYMVYNILAAYAVTSFMGVPAFVFQKALLGYHPENGRLQKFLLDGQEVILNLAKNPTGFNQNISLLLQDERPKCAFFVVNDNFNDGKDISWIWDVDFERLTAEKDLAIFVGGTRANDLAVRMKYAGFGSVPLYFSVKEALAAVKKEGASRSPLYVLTNYSALWPLKGELERMVKAKKTERTEKMGEKEEKRDREGLQKKDCEGFGKRAKLVRMIKTEEEKRRGRAS